jgi:carbonic anhydrase/acetyltransferase-like protein (isoleucine patch superfamily)
MIFVAMINAQSLTKEIQKGNQVFIADTARVLGNVKLGDEVSVWYGVSIRGDAEHISIGNRSNIQDNAVIHADPGIPCIIGEECIIGHCAIVHGARLSNNVLIGMNATILNHVQIGEFSIIGAGAVVSEGTVIPPYSLVLGVPGKVVKTLDESYVEKIKINADSYCKLSKIYLEAFK